jgi:hypothetical protein
MIASDMTPCSFNDNLYTCFMSLVCKLHILPDFGHLHTITTVMNTPAAGGITQ